MKRILPFVVSGFLAACAAPAQRYDVPDRSEGDRENKIVPVGSSGGEASRSIEDFSTDHLGHRLHAVFSQIEAEAVRTAADAKIIVTANSDSKIRICQRYNEQSIIKFQVLRQDYNRLSDEYAKRVADSGTAGHEVFQTSSGQGARVEALVTGMSKDAGRILTICGGY